MLFLLLSLFIIGLSLTGTGYLAGKLAGVRSIRNPWLYWWLGFFTVSTVSMFFSLFFPVNTVSLIVFFIVGITGLSLLCREYKASIVRELKIPVTALIYLIFLAGFSFLLAVTGLTGSNDTTLYHTQTVRWLNEYGTVAGMGNLHARLAFNSSWLSFAALLDNGPWDNRSEVLLPALSWFGVCLYFLHELLFTRRNGIRLYALCILLWAMYHIDGISPRLYYDDPVHLINAIVVLEAFYLLDKNKRFEEKMSNAACILMLSAAGFMIKPIGALSLMFTGALVIFLLVRNKKPFALWVKVLCPAAFAVIVWIMRNILLSGYPLYPVPVLPLPFDWTMTYEAAKSNYDDVVGWARMPGAGYRESLTNGFFYWFKPWLASNLRSNNFLFLAVLPLSIALFCDILVARLARSKRTLFFLVWSNCNILYWFLSAPDIRFGGGFFWVNLAVSLLVLFPTESPFNFSLLWNNKITRALFYYISILAIIGIIVRTALSSTRSFFTVETAQILSVKEYVVNAEVPFTIWIPSEPEKEGSTGNSPLPSAPGPVHIEMRKSGNLGEGFRPIR
jgi:hypothetical protein